MIFELELYICLLARVQTMCWGRAHILGCNPPSRATPSAEQTRRGMWCAAGGQPPQGFIHGNKEGPGWSLTQGYRPGPAFDEVISPSRSLTRASRPSTHTHTHTHHQLPTRQTSFCPSDFTSSLAPATLKAEEAGGEAMKGLGADKKGRYGGERWRGPAVFLSCDLSPDRRCPGGRWRQGQRPMCGAPPVVQPT